MHNGTNPGRLHEKVALITGAGRGVGHEIALRFAREGARVVIADLRRFPASPERRVPVLAD